MTNRILNTVTLILVLATSIMMYRTDKRINQVRQLEQAEAKALKALTRSHRVTTGSLLLVWSSYQCYPYPPRQWEEYQDE